MPDCTMHFKGQKFVAILDPGMATGEPVGTYPSFEEGDELDVWVLDKAGNPLKGFNEKFLPPFMLIP